MKSLGSVVLLCSFLFACAGKDDDDDDDDVSETRVGAVSSISNWLTLPSLLPVPNNAPSFAKASNRWVVTAQVNDAFVYTTYEDPANSGTFHSPWNYTTPPAGIFFGTQPDVVALPDGHFLIVILGLNDQQIWGQVQDYTGTVVYTAWHVIQAGAIFDDAPSIALNTGPGQGPYPLSPTLMIVGRGLNNHLYAAKNVLSGTYANSGWSGFTEISTTAYSKQPAVVDTCHPANTIAGPDFWVAAKIEADGSYEYYTNRGTSWEGPYLVANGLFRSAPALGCGYSLSNTSIEISIWGIGFSPYQLWHSEQLSGGPLGFTAVGSSGLPQNVTPRVRGFQNKLKIGVHVNGAPAYANANSP